MVACVVPSCCNTKKQTPEKRFFSLPSEKKMRDKWCLRIKINCDIPEWKTATVCEDHFNLQCDKDLDSSIKVRLDRCAALSTLLSPGEQHTMGVPSEEVPQARSPLNNTPCTDPDTRTDGCGENLELPHKDVLQEKVIEEEAWPVTALPQGYECVDALFVVEAEGTCMLQQEIPVGCQEPSQMVEVQSEETCEGSVNEAAALSEQVQEAQERQALGPGPGPVWRLLPGAGGLEAEEEKEMMEHKLVLEPRLMAGSFLCVQGHLRDRPGTPMEDPQLKQGTKDMTEKAPLGVNVKVKVQPEEVACH